MFKIKRNTNGVSLLKRRAWFDGEGTEAAATAEQGSAAAPPLQLTEEQVKQSAWYKELLAESVGRRQKIKELEAQLVPPPAQASAAETPAPTTSALTVEAVNALLAEGLAKVDLRNKQDALLDQYKVPVEDREMWRDANVDSMTKRLQKAFGVVGSASSGNGSGDSDPFSEVRTRIRARIRGEENQTGANIYSPESQRRISGGVVTN